MVPGDSQSDLSFPGLLDRAEAGSPRASRNGARRHHGRSSRGRGRVATRRATGRPAAGATGRPRRPRVPVRNRWSPRRSRRFDRLSDSLARAVRNFQDRAALFGSGRMDCGGLATGLVAVDNLWIT